MAGLTAGLAASGAAMAAIPKNKQKVVYHLSDAEKVSFVLSNIQNHIAGVGGSEYVEIVLVVHGPALKAFHQAAAIPRSNRPSAISRKRASRSTPAPTR